MPEHQAIPFASLPQLGTDLHDGKFGGVITLADGKHYAVVKLDAQPPKRASADVQRAWAKGIGAQLITRAIGSLLVSTIPHLLPQEWVWTCEDDADDSSYAWYCHLGYGSFNYGYRSASGGAVAIRLIPLAP